MRISEDGKILDVASFNPASQTASTNPGHTKDGVLTVEVSFKSTSHEITYSVDGKGGTLTAVNENDKKINSGLVDENAYRHALDKYTPERLGGMVRDFINSQMNNR